MKTWIKRSLIGLTAATLIVGGLAACGSRGEHARGWSEERVTEMRGKVVEKIASKLELNAEQKLKLGVLALLQPALRRQPMGPPARPGGAGR